MKNISIVQKILSAMIVVVVLLLWFFVSLTSAFFWGLFLVWAVFKLDSRYVAGGALVLLVLIPIGLAIGVKEELTEGMAVYVFFFLCITVALQIIEMWREPKGEEEMGEMGTGTNSSLHSDIEPVPISRNDEGEEVDEFEIYRKVKNKTPLHSPTQYRAPASRIAYEEKRQEKMTARKLKNKDVSPHVLKLPKK